MRHNTLSRVAFGVSGVLMLVSALSAADKTAPTLKQGNIEAGAFVGGGYGLGGQQGGNFHVMGGGDFGYAITKSVFLFGEGSYFPSVFKIPPVLGTPPKGITYSATPYERSLAEFNGGVHLRLPVPESRVVPYVLGALGGVHAMSTSTTETIVDSTLTPAKTTTNTLPLAGGSAFLVSGGGGVRIYATERFGFRGEFKIYKPVNGTGLNSFFRFAGGVFFQLK